MKKLNEFQYFDESQAESKHQPRINHASPMHHPQSFNSEFDELHTAERALSVPDSTLRAELRKTISEKLVPVWSEFYYKYVSTCNRTTAQL